MGQTLIALDPDALSGGAFLERMGVLLRAMGEEDGVRLPGLKRWTPAGARPATV